MLTALGINKTEYIHQTRVNDIQQQMSQCSDCTNTDECDEKLSTADVDISDIEFCNNEDKLKEVVSELDSSDVSYIVADVSKDDDTKKYINRK